MEDILENYTRVTTPLERYSGLDKIDPVVLQNAADRGTKVHNYCELYAKKEYYPGMDKEIKPFVDSFTQWFEEMVEKVLFLEQRIYNDRYMITGAIDAVFILRGDKYPTIVDYKTPQTESKTWALQTSAYLAIYNELMEGKKTAKRRICLQLSKKGKYPKVVEYTDFERDWKLYKGILEAHRYFQ